MFGLLFVGLLLAVSVFLALFFGSKIALDCYFEDSDYLRKVESKRIASLQKYVTDNNLSPMDADMLSSWAVEQNINYFTISRKRELLFDSSYMARLPLGETDDEFLHYTWQYMHTVSFRDGDADVLIYEGFESKYYVIALVFCILLSVFVLLFLLINGVQQEVKYIKVLKEEIDVIKGGCLEHEIEVKGEDELAQLAYGLNQMRISLRETNQKEEEMRVAQDELITGMSHDLRTPLTGLMTYLEILKQEEKEKKKISSRYIEKAYDKSLQIRTLSDQMFEFFLARKEDKLTLEQPQNIEYIFSDVLSDMVIFLQSTGFCVNTEAIEWRTVKIRVNMDYISRIINNILSNIQKYADASSDVVLSCLYEENLVGIAVVNKKLSKDEYVRGTGIGTKNIELMMKKMSGEVQIEEENSDYKIIIWFPFQ